MDNSNPSFYLCSVERVPQVAPTKCFPLTRLAVKDRDDYLVVRVDPPIGGQHYGLTYDIDRMVLATRSKGTTLHPINDWPLDVYVCLIKDEQILKRGTASGSDVEFLFMGQLLPTLEEAKEFMSHFPPDLDQRLKIKEL